MFSRLNRLLDSADPKEHEVRSRATKKRGWIYLLEQGTGRVLGLANLVDCRRMTAEDRRNCKSELESLPYPDPWLWLLSDKRRLEKPWTLPSHARFFYNVIIFEIVCFCWGLRY